MPDILTRHIILVLVSSPTRINTRLALSLTRPASLRHQSGTLRGVDGSALQLGAAGATPTGNFDSELKMSGRQTAAEDCAKDFNDKPESPRQKLKRFAALLLFEERSGKYGNQNL